MLPRMSDALGDCDIAFIGGGNMARCLIGGALDAGVAAARIRVGEPSAEARAALQRDFGVACHTHNHDAVADADVIVFAVKPQHAAAVCRAVGPALADGTLVVSIMAGITRDALRRWLGPAPVIVRTIPNTPALVGRGVTVLHAHRGLRHEHRALAEALLATAGATVWVGDESLMDVATALSGSGPAYFFLVLEALAEAATAAGMDAGDARELAVRTMAGAAAMAARDGVDPAELRRQVTSPGGTTAAALAELDAAGVREAFAEAVRAGTARSRALADEFGGD